MNDSVKYFLIAITVWVLTILIAHSILWANIGFFGIYVIAILREFLKTHKTGEF